MKILSKTQFLNNVPVDDVYLVSIEECDNKRVFHILGYSEEINESPGLNEPCGMFIPEDTLHDDLWEAIADRLDDVTLYGGPFDDSKTWQEHYEEAFIDNGANNSDPLIISVESTKEALAVLRVIAAAYSLKNVNDCKVITLVV